MTVRLSRRVGKVALVVALGMSAGVFALMGACVTTGSSAEGERLGRMERSPQWKDGKFVNRRPRVQGSVVTLLWESVFGGSPNRTPTEALPVQARKRTDFDAPPDLRATWLGHSTLIVEIEGKRLLVDPVWGERASPFSFAGPERWYAPPLPLEQLPDIDAVLISHDHYDHLDHPTVVALAAKNVHWIVPLGIGAHLEYWGVRSADISEMDWWDATSKVPGLNITVTPARHFSGRWLSDQEATLWCGFAIHGAKRRVYYSGDTALFDELQDIGARLGPFDLTMIEVGAYNQKWSDVHLGPEQAVRAHQLVRGDVFLPVHWGLFNLAFHGWTEPIERVLVAAKEKNVRVAVVKPGESVTPPTTPLVQRWWPELPWLDAKASPVQSTGVEYLMQ